MRLSRLGISILYTTAGLALTNGWEAEALPQSRFDDDACFMVTSSGKYLDLDTLCKKNPPLAKPQPKKTVKTATARLIPTPSYPASINLKAFLKVIRYAEGTSSEDGYQIQYTGARFYSFADHPRRTRCGSIKGDSVCSTAAGAYQFLETTWDDVAYTIGASDFSPNWQDRGAIELIRRAGALDDVESSRIEDAIAKLAPVWASFPRWYGDGRGSYDQSVVPMSELLQEFSRQQQMEANYQGYTPPVAAKPETPKPVRSVPVPQVEVAKPAIATTAPQPVVPKRFIPVWTK